MWLLSTGGVLYAPPPPKRNADVRDVWVSSTLRVERVSDHAPQMSGEIHGYSARLYGTWSDPQMAPSAYMLLGTGDMSDVKAVTMYVRGKGKYRVQVFLQKGERLHMTQTVVEATDSWSPISISTAHTIEVIGGLMERPDVRFPFKVVILPYMDKETGEVSRAFDLYVSPVSVVR